MKTVKSTVTMPIEISKAINDCIDRFDSKKPSNRQEFFMIAITEMLSKFDGKVTEDINRVESCDSNTFLERWKNKG
jgi:hypothetical protein